MARFKDIGYLLKEESILDKLNRPKISYQETKVFCNIKSITQSEFYQAQVVGLKPEIKIEVKCTDLTDITHFKLNDKIYKILRLYPKEDIVEIVLTSMVINNEK